MSAVYDRISRLLYERGIDLFAPIKLSDCKITKKYLLDRISVSESDGRAIMLAVPYLANDSTCGNISEYAKSRRTVQTLSGRASALFSVGRGR